MPVCLVYLTPTVLPFLLACILLFLPLPMPCIVLCGFLCVHGVPRYIIACSSLFVCGSWPVCVYFVVYLYCYSLLTFPYHHHPPSPIHHLPSPIQFIILWTSLYIVCLTPYTTALIPNMPLAGHGLPGTLLPYTTHTLLSHISSLI